MDVTVNESDLRSLINVLSNENVNLRASNLAFLRTINEMEIAQAAEVKPEKAKK